MKQYNETGNGQKTQRARGTLKNKDMERVDESFEASYKHSTSPLNISVFITETSFIS